MARALSQLNLSIDKFHFRKGHAGCKRGGSRELPAVWPSASQSLLNLRSVLLPSGRACVLHACARPSVCSVVRSVSRAFSH
eukprot:10898017-Lingulodinium_polyedra.AAC.1